METNTDVYVEETEEEREKRRIEHARIMVEHIFGIGVEVKLVPILGSRDGKHYYKREDKE